MKSSKSDGASMRSHEDASSSANAKRSYPKMLVALAGRVIKRDDRDTASGDLIEMYLDIEGLVGAGEAKKALLREILLSLPGFLRSVISWRLDMLGNYFRIALRNLKRHKGFSAINISGLAIGLAGCIMMLLWIGYIRSFDRYLPGWERTHQVLIHGIARNNPSTPAPLAPLLGENYPEIESVTRYAGTREMLVAGPDEEFYEGGIKGVDDSFFDVFPFEFVYGDPREALKDPESIILTETIARKYFPGVNPLGRSLRMDNSFDFRVTGVIRDVPANSTIRFRMLFPIERKFAFDARNGMDSGWDTFNTSTYLRLAEGVTAADINPKIVDLVPKHHEPYHDVEISVIPFSDRIYFFSSMKEYTYLLTAIALFVLVIACINFTNLSTARSANRAREIGVRKVAGAKRADIITQFIGESVFISLIALTLAVILVILILPWLSMRLQVGMSAWALAAPGTALLIILMTVVTGVVAGVYPAFFLSSFMPQRVLKSLASTGRNRGRLRSGMVVFQFILASLLITATGAVYRQHEFIKRTSSGFDRENIVNIDLRGDTSDRYESIKQELLGDERIVNVSGSSAGMPYFSWSTGSAKWEGMEPGAEYMVYFNGVDYDFTETFSIEILEGRTFSEEYPADAGLNVVINESMAELMGGGPMLGRRLEYWDRTGSIVGVVRNFHFQTMENRINPMMLILSPEDISVMSIKLGTDDVRGAIERIREVWEENLPGYPFEYRFIDDIYAERYSGVAMTRNVFSGFSMLAVFVACMGLLGLASFIAERRSKEIGIRKVLGADGKTITGLMLKEFIVCVVLANLVALPLSWILIRRWLENYAYRIDPGLELFLLPLVFTLTVSLLTVSFQTVRSVRQNPVESLRYE